MYWIYNFLRFNLLYLRCRFFENYLESKNQVTYKNSFRQGARIAIYGFGTFAIVPFLDLFNKYKITNIYDRNYYFYGGFIKDPEKICDDSFDYLIVCVTYNQAKNEISKFLVNKKIEKNKVIYLCNKYFEEPSSIE